VSTIVDGLRAHAEGLTEAELARRGSAVAALPAEQRARVEALVGRVAAELADGVLDHARTSPAVASALASIYGARGSAEVIESALGTAD
jgi:hypothetical protein